MKLQEILKYMFNNCKPYNIRKTSPLNKYNNVFQFVQNIDKKFDMGSFPGLKIDASVGQTPNWGLTPWIRIFDPNSSARATSGFYVVYLFSSDLDRVYLSLNRGVTKFKAAKHRTKKNSLISSAAYCREKLDIKKDPKINLGPYYIKHPTLTKEYEYANMFSICYAKPYILSDNKTINKRLMNDLQSVIGLYKQLLSLNIDPNSTKAKDLHQFEGRKVVTVNIPHSKGSTHKRQQHRRPMSSIPHNYLKIHKNNMTVGDYGEYIIKKKEEERYSDDPDIIVEHASKDTNDHANYDIDIRDKNKGIIKKIEIKTTKSSYKRSKFHITSNEVKCLINDPDNYVLARVYNLKDNDSPILLFFINGHHLLDHMKFVPASYQVSFDQPSDSDKRCLFHYFNK